MITDAVSTETYNGYTIAIVPDSDPICPRNTKYNDPYGEFYLWESGYISPDGKKFGDESDLRDYLTIRRQERHDKDAGVILLPVYHDGYSGRYTVGDEWDGDDETGGRYNGRSYRPDGVIYITYEDARKESGRARLTPKIRADIVGVLRSCVEEYSDWAIGNVYGYVIGDAEDDHIDSCWGFSGDYDRDADGSEAYIRIAAREAVDGLIAGGRLARTETEDETAEDEIAEFAADDMESAGIAAD